jgi:hypothetical protein
LYNRGRAELDKQGSPNPDYKSIIHGIYREHINRPKDICKRRHGKDLDERMNARIHKQPADQAKPVGQVLKKAA